MPARGELDYFEPENVVAYEAGGKSRLLHGRLTLNAAAFYYDFEDLQVNTTTLTANGTVTETANAAKAEIYGIDADAACAISDRLTLSGGVIWTPLREFEEFTDYEGSYSGNKLVRAPEWSANAAIEYEMPLRDLGELFDPAGVQLPQQLLLHEGERVSASRRTALVCSMCR